MAPHIVLHCTAYDGVPSGARNRAVGLAAAFLRAGCRVTALSPAGLSMTALVEAEADAAAPSGLWREIPTDLDPRRAAVRAIRAPSVAERETPRDADVFLTDYQPVLDRVPTALTVHDLRYLAAPDSESQVRIAAFTAMFPALARRARWIVVPSRAVADEFARLVGEVAAPVVVVPNAPGAVWRKAARISGAGTHLLVVGVADRRKRFAMLLDALRRARARGPVLPLVIAGRSSRRFLATMRGANDLVRSGALRWIESPADDEVVRAMRGAAALLHPSAYEGFGMTILEAFACGVPVVARRGPAVEEVAGGLAQWIERDDADGWADAILIASSQGPGRCEGSDLRRARAAEFTWDASAASFLSALARLIR